MFSLPLAIEIKCLLTNGRILIALGVARERIPETDSRVGGAGHRSGSTRALLDAAHSRVVATALVREEPTSAHSRIVFARDVEKKRIVTHSSVVAARAVLIERTVTHSRVEGAFRVV